MNLLKFGIGLAALFSVSKSSSDNDIDYLNPAMADRVSNIINQTLEKGRQDLEDAQQQCDTEKAALQALIDNDKSHASTSPLIPPRAHKDSSDGHKAGPGGKKQAREFAIKRVEQECADEIVTINTEHADELARLNSEHTKELATVTLELATNNAEYAYELERLNKEHADELESSKSKLTIKMYKKCQSEQQEQAAEYNGNIRAISAECGEVAAENIQGLHDSLSDQIAALSQDLLSLVPLSTAEVAPGIFNSWERPNEPEFYPPEAQIERSIIGDVPDLG